MTTFTRKTIAWAVKADPSTSTPPDLGVDTDGTLRLATPVGATTFGIPFKDATGTLMWLSVVKVAPT